VAKRSQRGNVVLGFRIICSLAFIGIAYHDYVRGVYLSITQANVMLFLMACDQYSWWRGRKLADKNIRQSNTNMDRDEAITSRKPIDNRS
jgi:hypothetical protein